MVVMYHLTTFTEIKLGYSVLIYMVYLKPLAVNTVSFKKISMKIL